MLTSTRPLWETQALLPNRVGQPRSALNTTYLTATDSTGGTSPQSNSVNEPWDAADVSNMWLSGTDGDGNLLPSFYRQKLIENAPLPSTLDAGRTFFHAFDIDDDDMPDVDTDGDGVKDAFWMETGESVITNRNGKRFKPLFAIRIRDLDGMLNVNAHGNRTHLLPDGYVDTQLDWAGSAPNKHGFGMGPAEISLVGAVGGDNSKFEALLNSRYGDDGLPGNGVDSFRSRAKLFGSPRNEINPGMGQYGTIGNLYSGSPMDIHGRFLFGFPANSSNRGLAGFQNFADPNFAVMNNSMPQINVLTSQDIDTFTDEFSGNPYEMWLGGPTGPDNPFTAEELERVLRPTDYDSPLLADRLSRILDGAGSRSITTHSFDVPMLYQDFVETLVREIPRRNESLGTGGAVASLVNTLADPTGQFAFAPELFRGLKMDINRPFGEGIDNNGNGVVDEPGESIGDNTDAATLLGGETAMDLTYGSGEDARLLYARHLYMLVMLLVEPNDLDKDDALTGTGAGTTPEDDPERLAFAKSMAQWVANVVDFRDPDSINTRFDYDPFPWDASGWNPDGTFFVWGAERPELLITETLAVHIQNMERVAPTDPDNLTYHQRLRPEPFAYFEVYNPWTQNRLNQILPAELYDGDGVDLDANNGSPVWRFEVERAETAANGTIQYKPLRYVYMTDPGNSITYSDTNENQVAGDIEIFFTESTDVTARPGRQVLIGTQGFGDGDTTQVFMGRRTGADDMMGTSAANLMLDQTTRLALNADDGTVTRHTGDVEDRVSQTSIVYIDRSATGATPGNSKERKFSLSDRFDGYPTAGLTAIPDGDGSVYATPTSTLDTEDNGRTEDEINNMIRIQDGISKNFRFVRLQRLANPLLAWNADSNPYLTIDSMEVDLVSINGAAAPDMSLNEPDMTQAVSHERGSALVERNGVANQNPSRLKFWGFQREATIRNPTGTVGESGGHHYALAFSESLGQTNDSFVPGSTSGSVRPFPSLAWNNRPFVSHMEIMNVPYLPSDRLTYAPEIALDPLAPYQVTQPFTVTSTRVPGTNAGTTTNFSKPSENTRPGALAGRYGHLLNFFAGEADAAGTNQFSDIYKLLDFIEVPSRYVSSESYYLTGGATDVLSHPFNTISRYRAPGLVNINTMPENVWSAIVGANSPSPSFGDVRDSIFGRSFNSSPITLTNPIRPAGAANLIPGIELSTVSSQPGVTNTGAMPIAGSACTLVRSDGDNPLFDNGDGTNRTEDADRNAFIQNRLRTRLGNLVTNKSSVFACWITVGYFEVDENGDLVDTSGVAFNTDKTTVPTLGNRVVAEVDAEFGEQVRHRAFFIYDRSIPVAFEPGKNHNVEKGILVKSLIE